ncbi:MULTISPECIES: hypothetical protein [unclassified Yoonia]|uniref:hypothetical protein n=1 Tax=unclassified Yoonia TaxID=2629118 RepID=UPI002AFF7B82|nr:MULTISPECIES: hypothetical protein [unclassified Yoonia]
MGSDIHIQIEEIRALIDQKLGVRARTFEAQVRKARRFLPRGLRRELIYVAQAQALVDNPKLQRMIDHQRLDAAYRNAVYHLQRIDVKERRRTAALNLAASIAFGLLVTGILVLVVLVQRDLI